MKKIAIAILMTALMLVSIVTPLISTAQAADPSSWYKTVPGQLATDTYTLYPYSAKSLNIGFSQFGEMINTMDNVGLEYGSVDPFAPAAGSSIGSIPKVDWLQGWFINITYYHRILSQVRTVWACALHADAQAYGGNWIRVDFNHDYDTFYGLEDARDPGYIIGDYAAGANNFGGRKTNGTAVTQPIETLYDGPRLYVARLTTDIYDHPGFLTDDTTGDVPLLSVRITVYFDKVKKEVVLFKDLKTLVSDKIADELKVQFSNRGEVDLGTETVGYDSYFHFYTQGTSQYNSGFNDTAVEGLPTVYDRNWVMNQTENPATSSYKNYSAAGPYPQTSSATYDLAVAINPDAGYTWWAAFWPSLSDWSIDGWDMWWRSMSATDPHDIDSRTWAPIPRTEPTIPFYIGEWDCVLKPKTSADMQQYRFVTIYGVTDDHDAKDHNMVGAPANTPDRETMYQLNEYFNPWDLNQAVLKDTNRYVEFSANPIGSTTYTTKQRPVVAVPDSVWDQYNMQSERVEDLTTGKVLNRYKGDYDFVQLSTGYGYFTGLTSTHKYKFLYSTLPEYGKLPFTVDATPSVVNATIYQDDFTLYPTISSSWTDPTGVSHSLTNAGELGITITNMTQLDSGTTTDQWYNYTTPLEVEWEVQPFKVFKEDTTTLESGAYNFAPSTVTNETSGTALEFTVDGAEFTWSITGPRGTQFTDLKDVHFTYFSADWYVYVDVFYNATEGTYTIYPSVSFGAPALEESGPNAVYQYWMPGRYEWGIVGRDSEVVDSAGLANVAAAFKDKQVEFALSGADMFDPVIANQMPWVMAKIGTGDTGIDYFYNPSGFDFRNGLKDDFCTTYPISSSNMIGIGGPLANQLALYGNPFMSALYGIPGPAYAPWTNNIVPVTCWAATNPAHLYADTNTTGYAVISTYQDLNGTNLFLVWGNWGRDTYYASKWFHDWEIMELQSAPPGVNSIVVKITYSSSTEGYKPTGFSIVEVLGTISERQWKYSSDGLTSPSTTLTKGGIHDP
jgi:hypothetical protein